MVIESFIAVPEYQFSTPNVHYTLLIFQTKKLCVMITHVTIESKIHKYAGNSYYVVNEVDDFSDFKEFSYSQSYGHWKVIVVANYWFTMPFMLSNDIT